MFVWSKLSSAKWEDAWEERFLSQGQTNAVISRLPGRRSIRVEVYCEDENSAREIVALFGGSYRELADRNWAAIAPPPVRPIRIRDALIVLPGEDAEVEVQLAEAHPDRSILVIPPAMAFGTGDHATTATCLRLLVDAAREFGDAGWSLLDAGTGTGILAIAACKLGAAPVAAFDFDPHAIKAAKGNARRNGIAASGITFDGRDALLWKPKRGERWHCIAANLFSDVLKGTFPAIVRTLRPEGCAIVSGILHDHADDCLAEGRRCGLRWEKRIRRGKWVTALGRKA